MKREKTVAKAVKWKEFATVDASTHQALIAMPDNVNMWDKLSILYSCWPRRVFSARAKAPALSYKSTTQYQQQSSKNEQFVTAPTIVDDDDDDDDDREGDSKIKCSTKFYGGVWI